MKSGVTVVGFIFALALTQAAGEFAFNKSLEDLRIGPFSQKMDTGDVIGMQTEWITQKLNHFNKKDKRTWNMRYMADVRFFKSGGPIFIYLYGENPIKPSLRDHIITDLAKEHNGILFYPEHRYYGESKPTAYLSTENLKFLNVQQALADLAHFIKTQRYNHNHLKQSKVIISGCSYGGSMAIWFSKLYPNLVHGIWASSAPTLAKVNFKEHKEMVGEIFQILGSQQCYERIQNGIARLEAMFKGNRGADAQQMLNLCSDFDHKNRRDLSSLFNSLANAFTNNAQCQREGDIPEYCRALMSFKDDVTAVAQVFSQTFSKSDGCIAVDYQGFVDTFKKTSYDYGDLRQWIYQQCNEFGWFQTSSSQKQPFGSLSPVQYFIKMCSDVFGSKYTEEHINQLAKKTNKKFRSKKYKMKNMYITYGDLDPWTSVGMLEDATYISRAGHCADLDSITEFDSPSMRESKTRLFQLARKWLK